MLDPAAVSPVGARGLCQAMPGTWSDIEQAMGWKNVSPHSPHHCIFGGAYYQSRMDRIWRKNRSIPERHDLGLASYNAGAGRILEAQRRCGNPSSYGLIVACLAEVTGRANAKQTTDYVDRIARWRALMEAGR